VAFELGWAGPANFGPTQTRDDGSADQCVKQNITGGFGTYEARRPGHRLHQRICRTPTTPVPSSAANSAAEKQISPASLLVSPSEFGG